jgi:hypothetical protein
MRDGLACSRLASRRRPTRGVTQKRYGSRTRSRNVLRARHWQRYPTETEVPALMKVLIGVDPHKASVAVAVVDEHVGELLERASFPQSCAGLRALERFKRNDSPSVVGRWRTPVASAGTWRGGWQRPASPWWTCRRSFQRGCACSRVATPARTTGSTPSPPPRQPRATGGWLWSIPRPPRSCCASFPRGAKSW